MISQLSRPRPSPPLALEAPARREGEASGGCRGGEGLAAGGPPPHVGCHGLGTQEGMTMTCAASVRAGAGLEER